MLRPPIVHRDIYSMYPSSLAYVIIQFRFCFFPLFPQPPNIGLALIILIYCLSASHFIFSFVVLSPSSFLAFFFPQLHFHTFMFFFSSFFLCHLLSSSSFYCSLPLLSSLSTSLFCSFFAQLVFFLLFILIHLLLFPSY